MLKTGRSLDQYAVFRVANDLRNIRESDSKDEHYNRIISEVQSSVNLDEKKTRCIAAAIFMLREEMSLHDADNITHLASTLDKDIFENTTVSIGGGAMDNTIAPVDPQDQPTFGNCKVFRVNGTTFHQCRQKKPHERFSKIVGEDPQFESIRAYARRNPSKSIVLQDEQTGAYTVLKFGKNQWW